jgi:hypothetical protein
MSIIFVFTLGSSILFLHHIVLSIVGYNIWTRKLCSIFKLMLSVMIIQKFSIFICSFVAKLIFLLLFFRNFLLFFRDKLLFFRYFLIFFNILLFLSSILFFWDSLIFFETIVLNFVKLDLFFRYFLLFFGNF